MGKKSFSARIEEETYARIDDYCREHNLSQAQWLERAVKQLFGESELMDSPDALNIDDRIQAAIAPMKAELKAELIAELQAELGKSAA